MILELGGNAAAVVLADWSSDEDLEWAAARIATFGNYQAGQSCISVQRVFVDESVYDEFVPLLVDKMKALTTGSPSEDDVVVGPVINEAAAERIAVVDRRGRGRRRNGAHRRHPGGHHGRPDAARRRARRGEGLPARRSSDRS